MNKYLFIVSALMTILSGQPKEGIEFKVNTISGFVIDSLTNQPVMDVNIDIYTGNGVLKHSSITDEFGSYTISNIIYDNMQMWFEHGYFDGNIYVFRKALVKKNNSYVLNNSLFNSTTSIHLKLNKLKNKIIKKSNKDFDKTANLIKKYGNVTFGYVLKNDDKTFFKNFRFKCVLE